MGVLAWFGMLSHVNPIPAAYLCGMYTTVWIVKGKILRPAELAVGFAATVPIWSLIARRLLGGMNAGLLPYDQHREFAMVYSSQVCAVFLMLPLLRRMLGKQSKLVEAASYTGAYRIVPALAVSSLVLPRQVVFDGAQILLADVVGYRVVQFVYEHRANLSKLVQVYGIDACNYLWSGVYFSWASRFLRRGVATALTKPIPFHPFVAAYDLTWEVMCAMTSHLKSSEKKVSIDVMISRVSGYVLLAIADVAMLTCCALYGDNDVQGLAYVLSVLKFATIWSALFVAMIAGLGFERAVKHFKYSGWVIGIIVTAEVMRDCYLGLNSLAFVCVVACANLLCAIRGIVKSTNGIWQKSIVVFLVAHAVLLLCCALAFVFA